MKTTTYSSTTYIFTYETNQNKVKQNKNDYSGM